MQFVSLQSTTYAKSVSPTSDVGVGKVTLAGVQINALFFAGFGTNSLTLTAPEAWGSIEEVSELPPPLPISCCQLRCSARARPGPD